MDRVLQILITAKDLATKELKGLEGALKSAEKASDAFALGLAGVATVAGLCIKEYSESETAVTKLSHILKTATGASDAQVKSLVAQADALQKVGIVSDDTIVALQGQLATFNFTTDTIKSLTPAILDVVVAEKGVNATTEDMISYGNAFGMAMEGNYASLTKRGFKLDENTKAIIANGTETEKANAILKVLDGTYKGLNEKMTETSAGAMIRLNNQFKQLEEDIGKYLVPALIFLTTQLSNLMAQISPYIDKLPILFDWFSKNQQAIYLLAGAIVGGLAPAIGIAILNLGLLALELAPFIAGGLLIAGFVYGIIQIRDNWQGAWNTMTLTVGTAMIRIQTAFNNLKIIGISIMTGLQSGLESVWNGIIGTFKGGVNSVLSAVNFLIDQMNKIQFSIPSWVPSVGGKSFGINIGKVPYMASGGIVTGPTLAMVGEAGPEAIIPLNRANGVGGITVNINGGTYLSEDVAEEIGDKIINRLKTQLAI